MPSKANDIQERHPAERRVAVEANFNGYCREFGITVKKGKQYELSEEVINKYNKELKTKGGDKPFKILKSIEPNKKGTLGERVDPKDEDLDEEETGEEETGEKEAPKGKKGGKK
jgi:hypothetical protein